LFPAVRNLTELSGPRLWRTVLEVALVAVLGVQAARLAWVFFAPVTPPRALTVATPAPVRTDGGILQQFNPFEGETTALQGGPADTSGYRLFGVRRGGGLPASAIIGAPGMAQQSFAEGDEIAPGVVLRSVEADHVVIERAGAQSRIELERTAAGAGRASGPPAGSYTAPPPNVPPAAGVDPAAFLAGAGLQPKMVDGQVEGYTLVSRGSGTMERLGLRSGDVLVSVNGDRISPEMYSRLAEELAAEPNVELTVQRGAQTMTIKLGADG
jgi:general secretion pathway protein C